MKRALLVLLRIIFGNENMYTNTTFAYKDKYLHVAIIQNLLLYFLIPKKNFCVGTGGVLFILSNIEHF